MNIFLVNSNVIDACAAREALRYSCLPISPFKGAKRPFSSLDIEMPVARSSSLLSHLYSHSFELGHFLPEPNFVQFTEIGKYFLECWLRLESTFTSHVSWSFGNHLFTLAFWHMTQPLVQKKVSWRSRAGNCRDCFQFARYKYFLPATLIN